MEYGLWNFHGRLWAGGNNSFAPTEGISRNFYTSVNNDIESPTFQVTTPVNDDSVSLYSSTSQSCPSNLRNLEFLSMKGTVPSNGRISSMVLAGHQDDLLHSVALDGVHLASDLVSEQNSMDSLTPTDSSIPSLLSHQQNANNNNSSNINVDNSNNSSSCHNNSTLTNNLNHNSNSSNSNNNLINNDKSLVQNDDDDDDDDENDDDEDEEEDCNSSEIHKKNEHKTERRDNEEVWEDVSGHGTNIKLENNSAVDYLFQQSYQHPIYGVVFSKIASNRREAGTSDETDEEDDDNENDEAISQFRIIDSLHNNNNNNAFAQSRFRSLEKNEIDVHVARHIPGGYKLNGKKRSGPLTPQRVRYEREEYRCQICAYSCTVEKAFYKHLKIHSMGRQMGQVKISCVICGKDRSSEVDMNKHMKKHRDDRYFCCDICIFKTVQLKKLIQHRRMHTGEKPHLCPHCSYRSARRDNLRSHVRRVHKKDNLFCDTFSPRGLLLTENPTNISTSVSTPTISTATSSQPSQPSLNE